ncbi:hypothetical protein LSH36_276g01030 [Paralvinella palmiformis]|uniref:Uncharacterized protein n=1 Tax=Paralvinella palmiformis TaxID=53620 RepID=A0AAD9N4L4_9ANNE|nr:hypothetical protein LSH36_276g01030 [Paralvinella palmiformis]
MGISLREAFEALDLPFGTTTGLPQHNCHKPLLNDRPVATLEKGQGGKKDMGTEGVDGLNQGIVPENSFSESAADRDTVRTNYKRLAMKWLPENNNHSPESIKNFLEISMAYKRLQIKTDIVQMSVPDCIDLFKETFNQPKPAYSNGYCSSDDDSDLSDYAEKDDKIGHCVSNLLTTEEIERNANDLITEEEKEKRRAEKRRAKKKRKREKKRLEKRMAELQKKEEDSKRKPDKKDSTTNSKTKKLDEMNNDSSESETEGFDQSAAFFKKVLNKKKKAGTASESTSNTKPKIDSSKTTNGNEEALEDLDPVVLQSRQLAIEGNKMANLGHYQNAIELFTEAVRLDPTDFRFFGNRSYCYDRLQQYEKALKDADKAIHLAPDWAKGYFRKGRALAGLKLYSDAEQAFMRVLKLDRNCEDAMQELLRVRTHQLTEMGFSQQQAQNAIRQYNSVQQALDSLLAGVVAETSLGSEVYMSDDDDYGAASSPRPVVSPVISQSITNHSPPDTHHKPHDVKMETMLPIQALTPDSQSGLDVKCPGNPEGLTALWVGNVLPQVTEKRLNTMFSKFGQVTSVRLLPEKYCAFINFKTKESAGAAMKGLQGAPCEGQQLLIKFPDNPIVNGNSSNSVVIRKAGTVKQNTKPAAGGQSKMSGPVNGDECYFWRTTGCRFGKDCHYRHVPEHKGIDHKPWQRQ